MVRSAPLSTATSHTVLESQVRVPLGQVPQIGTRQLEPHTRVYYTGRREQALCACAAPPYNLSSFLGIDEPMLPPLPRLPAVSVRHTGSLGPEHTSRHRSFAGRWREPVANQSGHSGEGPNPRQNPPQRIFGSPRAMTPFPLA